MVLERTLVQWSQADEQMPEIDGASRLRKGGRHQNATGLGAGAERLADRPDVAGVGRVEGRADFIDDMARAAGDEPVVSRGRRSDRARGLDRADLQGDDDRPDIAGVEACGRDANRLYGREAVAMKRVRKVRRAGIVIGDSAEKERHVTPSDRTETTSVPQPCRRADYIRSRHSRHSRGGRTRRTGRGS